MEKTTKKEAVTRINDLQERMWLYQNQGVSMDDIPLVMQTLEDAITFAKVLFYEYVKEEKNNDTEV